MKKKIEEQNIQSEEIKVLKASEYAKQQGLDPTNFLWWDKNEGIISEKRFNEIKQIIYGNRMR